MRISLPYLTSKGKSRNTLETEAESVSYTVCDYFGIDTSDYSFGYIAGWVSTLELVELKESMETIRKTASHVISGIEDKLKELIKKRLHLKDETFTYEIKHISIDICCFSEIGCSEYAITNCNNSNFCIVHFILFIETIFSTEFCFKFFSNRNVKQYKRGNR